MSHDGSFALDRVVGPGGLQVLLAMIDVGSAHEPHYDGPRVVNLREWTELIRRLAIPYYEEPRLYWQRAKQSGYFERMNEFYVNAPETLQVVIETFGPTDEPTPRNSRA
jgi:hypothetical protein